MELQNLLNNSNELMGSREIAQLTGKEHRSVLRDVDNLNESYEKLGLHKVVQSSYLNEQGREFREMKLSKLQTLDLATGYDVALRIKMIRRWEELENRNIPKSFPEALKLAYEQSLIIEQQGKELKKNEAKIEFIDRVLDCDDKIDIGQSAKILDLGFGRNTLFKKLREKGIFFTNKNEPKQLYLDRKYFELRENWVEKGDKSFITIKVLVTQKGLGYLSTIFKSPIIENKLQKI